MRVDGRPRRPPARPPQGRTCCGPRPPVCPAPRRDVTRPDQPVPVTEPRFRAVKVTDGMPEQGATPSTVRTACELSFPDSSVDRSCSWTEQLAKRVGSKYLGQQAPTCHTCRTDVNP
jgi:hypothetical protein